MNRTQKILVSRSNLLNQNSLESYSNLLLLSKSLRETDILRVLSIRKIFRMSNSRKNNRLTEILQVMNPILFSILHNVAWHLLFLSRLEPQIMDNEKKWQISFTSYTQFNYSKKVK